jgi:hypothetical protein
MILCFLDQNLKVGLKGGLFQTYTILSMRNNNVVGISKSDLKFKNNLGS